MSHIRHSNKDLVLCRRQPGIQIGKVCDNCEGRCVICGSYTHQTTLVRLCEECSHGAVLSRCVTCGQGKGEHDAYYCRECVLLEKDRDGCPRTITVSGQKRDTHYRLTTT